MGEGRDDLLGAEMYSLIEQLYAICRSITGDGVRRTLEIVRQSIPLEIHEVPSGTSVFDWTVPNEWTIRDAYVKASDGRRVIDFERSNLHVVGYSVPVRTRMSLAELRQRIFTRPDLPDAIPYRTSYYTPSWGFCASQRDVDRLAEDDYEVVIDASLEPGSLTYGELYVPGRTPDEVLVSCHVCHPSLCNDNLSGIALAVALAKHVSGVPRRYAYRFLFIPGTIGSITWLARNERNVGRIKHGLVLALVGDPGGFTYKRSRRGVAEIDAAAAHVLRESGVPYKIIDFVPYGYDERQFCSPGFNLPVGCFMRTPHGEFPEYHTSADDLRLVQADKLGESFRACADILDVLEHNRRYENLNPRCEPQLGKRGLYQALGGGMDRASRELAMLWVLNQSDGTQSLLDIAERAGMRFALVKAAADRLAEHGLLRALDDT
jgi:aminopeptidase-like protein